MSKRRERERMIEMMKNEAPSHWWWLDSHSKTKRSPWLQSTLTELNEKTKAMLKLIEEDADSFAQRAEMYYKKRPQLVSMVEDFYRAHRSLAERCDQVAGIRLLKTQGSPFASPRYHQSEKLISFADNSSDSYSESCGIEESGESEVDDPEQEEEHGTKFDGSREEEEVRFETANDEVMMRLGKEIERPLEVNKDQTKLKHNYICGEVMMLREEIERLRKENRVQKDELKQKDTICGEVMRLREEIERVREENRLQKELLKQKDQDKIEVIRHLSLAVDLLKQENVKIRSFIAKMNKWKNPFEFNKLMGTLTGKLFNGITWNQPSIVAL